MYPGKEIKYEFDAQCYRNKQLVFTDGKPNCVHHLECNKVKVTVEGMEPKYVPIQSHRFNLGWANIKKLISEYNDVHIHENDLKQLKELKESDINLYNSKLEEVSQISGLSRDKIEEKL